MKNNLYYSLITGITFLGSTSSLAMDTSFTVSLVAAKVSNIDITLENYTYYCMPLVIPVQTDKDKVVINGSYSQTPYSSPYKKSCHLSPLICVQNNIQYANIPSCKTIIMCNKDIQEYFSSSITLNKNLIALPIAEGERLYAVIKYGNISYLKEFLDITMVDSESSILHYEPMRTFLDCINSDDPAQLDKNITTVQCHHCVDMKMEASKQLKNTVVSIINKKINFLKNHN